MAERRGLSGSGNTELGFPRYRPPADVVRELRGIRERYDMQAFSFIDDTFTMNHAWLRELLALYRQEIGVPFVCNTTAIDLDEDILDELAAAGCRIVRMGVESGSPRVVEEVLKRRFIGRDKLRWAFRAVQARGMHALAFSMIGNAGESRAEVEATLRFNAELAPTSMKLSLAQPYPGTDYHELAQRGAGIDDTVRVHNFIEQSVLRRPDDERLWLDKVRTFYFWYVSRELGNEGSPAFARLIDELEGLSEDRWHAPEIRAELWRRHEELARDLQARGVLHYTAPFGERTDIVVSGLVVAEHGELIRREQADPH